MKGALRFVIFALVCAYAHAQCCNGAVITMDGKDPVQPKTEETCKAGKDIAGNAGVWKACDTGLSCLAMKCTAKQGSTALAMLTTMCSTDVVMKALIDAYPKTLNTGTVTEAKCAAFTASGAPSSKFASGALLVVSAFVSLVVASV
jgi:hypothetical protein